MIADHAPPLRAVRPRPRYLGRCLLAGVAALLALHLGLAGGQAALAPAGARTVVVAPGETLWQVAEQHFPGDDPRLAVDEIMQRNGLTSVLLQPGEVLILPAR